MVITSLCQIWSQQTSEKMIIMVLTFAKQRKWSSPALANLKKWSSPVLANLKTGHYQGFSFCEAKKMVITSLNKPCKMVISTLSKPQ
jgi:hypothetical protein